MLRYANSGDTTGEKAKVVGYAAIGFSAESRAEVEGLSREAGQVLVKAARRGLQQHFNPPKEQTPGGPLGLDEMPELAQAHGMFVTLKQQGQLRGCIGWIESHQPLAMRLPEVTLDAALHDTRFAPVTAAELGALTIEVSVLSPSRPIDSPGEIVAGRDGVVLEKNGHSGVFLPQVWDETGWTRVEFLRELASQKAGLAPDAWKDARLSTFQAQVFHEGD